MGHGPAIPRELQERALDLWAAEPDRSGLAIAEALGLKRTTLGMIVDRARKADDPRAIHRKPGRPFGAKTKPPPAPPRCSGPNASRGIYRPPEVSRALKDGVLASWAEGLSALQCATRNRTSEVYVWSIVRRARAVRDPRAVVRRRVSL